MVYDDFSDLGDLQDDTKKSLDLTFIIMRQIDTIRNIASREFHKAIILYSDGGMARTYLPDVLESYCNAIENFEMLLIPYQDDEYKDNTKDLPKDRKDRGKIVYKQCLLLLKRLQILPKEHIIAEKIQPRKAKGK